jgi:glycosyltransferase involved in cell wall biosynthesis
MILGIDGSNVRGGGGITHLSEMLQSADPKLHGFNKVVLWGGSKTLTQIEDRNWLIKAHDPILDRGLVYRVFWQKFRLKALATQRGCNLLFVPGGSDASGFKPLVTMSQNMLPFEWDELKRFGLSWITMKMLLLRFTQSKTFHHANGVIFLTEYAQLGVQKVTKKLSCKTTIIPHGINSRFFSTPRLQKTPQEFSKGNPCRLLYVSIVDPYKHQWHLCEAVAKLRQEGIFLTMDLIGPPSVAMRVLEKTLAQVDPRSEFIKYHGAVKYEDLHEFYISADIGVFASSCENMPNILLENMAAGLPIACSNMGPMPEILGDAGIYFSPDNPSEIADALRQLINSDAIRHHFAKAAFERACFFSWQSCGDRTFQFLADTARDYAPTHDR